MLEEAENEQYSHGFTVTYISAIHMRWRFIEHLFPIEPQTIVPVNLTVKFTSILRDVTQKGFFHLLSANAITQFMGFGCQLLVIKFLSPTEMGNIKTIQSFTSVGCVLAGFGITTAVLKLCSEERSAEEKAHILRRSTCYAAVPVTIVLLALFGMAELNLLSPVRDINHWMVIYMFSIPLSVLSSLFMVYLQALKQIKLMAKMQIVVRGIGVVLLVSITYLYGFQGYIFSTILAGALAVLAILYCVRNDFKSAGKYDNLFPQIMHYAKWSLAANLVNTTSIYIDIFLLNYLVEDRVGLGYYSIATIFFMGLTQITATVQSITTPYFSEKSNNKEEFLRVLKKYQRIMIVGSFFVSASAIVIVPAFLRSVYGESYSLSGDLFRILCIRYFFMSCYALLGVAILGLGKMKYNFYTSIVTIAITIPLGYACIIWWGLFGAAIAQVVSCLLILLTMLAMARHVVRIHFPPKSINVYGTPEFGS